MSTPKYTVRGRVSPGFESVRSLFEHNFRAGREDSAGLVAYVGEERVVDLRGDTREDGDVDDLDSVAEDGPVNGDRLEMLFSASKAVVSVAVAVMVDRGLISYGDRVAQHWPEFAREGKEEITIEDVLR